MLTKRGALIVIEGVDRTGKTTQCKLLVENLKKMAIDAQYMNFPDRTTEIGKVIDAYLKSKNNLSDEAIHLLFSANRWEKSSHIRKLLDHGISIVMDRYCYSGVVFSSAKGLDLNWCKTSDTGLPQPDKVFFLNMPLEKVQERNGFGNERYENTDFQKKVMQMYMKLKDDSWDIVDASRTKEAVQDYLLNSIVEVVKNVGNKPVNKIVWTD
ncbi:thymidylate kinase [Aricia agestis]|uniref:thymidylate kinase n=1 Tax=Aricia agestis TaxID=91739 RepID=UPI001C204DC1|nr:thymidylate kinase [Aricia agestis]